jgi:NAD(P)-dependent dehydrogenase (short-subunit alcohol dehydrogenase family)
VAARRAVDAEAGADMNRFAGKRAWITGGASGIGLATARVLVAEGARVALLDVDAEAVERAAAEVGGIAQVADVRDAAALEAACAAAVEAFGGLDLVFANAGVGRVAPLADYAPADVEQLVAVNLLGVYHTLAAALPHLRAAGGGAIVTNASCSGIQPTRGEAPYSAAKAGVIALTQSAALEHGPAIRVNCVSPGMIRTPMSELLFQIPALMDPFDAAVPAGRAGTAEEVASVVCFLLSDDARYVTGANFVVDGGLSLVGGGIDPVLRRVLDLTQRR